MKKLYITFSFCIFLFTISFSQNAIAQFPTIAVSSPTATEGSAAIFVITLNSPWSSPITISIATTAMTAGSADYTNVATQVTIPTGATNTTVTVQTTPDNIHEPNETFLLTATALSSNTANTVATGTCTIVNTTPIPVVSVSNPFGFEGSTAIFEVRLTNPSSTPTVINFISTTGTASAIDFTTVSTTVTIPSGIIGTVVNVPITADATPDEGEKFTINGTITSSNTANTNAFGTCTIIEPNVLRTLTASPVTVTAIEGTTAVFKFALNYPSNVDTIINFQTQNGTAGTNDFTSISQTKTLYAGDESIIVNILTWLDNISEGTETFQLKTTVVSTNTTTNTTATTTTVVTATGIITDATMLPTVVITNATAAEGNVVVFVISLSNPSSVPTIITVTTTTGTATTADYTTTTMQLTIPAGATSIAVAVPTILDYFFEQMETFTLNGTIISTNTSNPTCFGTGSIVDAPTLKVNIINSYNDFNNDGLLNVGDVLYCQFSVSNLISLSATNVIVNTTQMTGTGTPIANVAAFTTSINAYSGTYYITQSDINNGFANISAQANCTINNLPGGGVGQVNVPLAITKGFKLNAFFDSNGNGFQDNQEPNFSQGTFKYQMNNGILHNVNASSGIFYLYENNPANVYTLSYTNTNFVSGCYGQYVITVPSYTNVTVGGSGILTYNFALTATPCTDLSVSVTNDDFAPRPGFEYKNYVFFRNNGNQNIASGTVTFTKNNVASLVSTSSPTTTTANGFTHAFTNLAPNEQRGILVKMLVPVFPTSFSGQILTNSVAISVPPNDTNTSNNNAAINQTVVNSWDPNDKIEMRGPKILHSSFTSNDVLTYKIQFENTGTAAAINIRIIDALSSKLDESTLQMIDASHSYVLDRTGANLEWKFSGINLPPSVTNTQIGHGYVVFQVKPKAGYAIGDIIANTANIYFDFNPAIVTNTWTTEFVATLGTSGFGLEKLRVYPNPATNILTIENQTNIESLTFSNLLGQTVLSKSCNDLTTQTDISNFAKGVYFVKIKTETAEQTIKILKE